MKALKGEITLPQSLVNRIVKKLLKKIQPELQKARREDVSRQIRGFMGPSKCPSMLFIPMISVFYQVLTKMC